MAAPIAQRGHGALRAQINVTPLVDVVLVLLIIFMVVTPLLSRGQDVQLPAAERADAKASAAEVVVLTLTPDRQLWLENRPIAPAELASALAAPAGRRRKLLLKADARLSMRELRPVLRRLRSAGFDEIGFGVVEPARGDGR